MAFLPRLTLALGMLAAVGCGGGGASPAPPSDAGGDSSSSTGTTTNVDAGTDATVGTAVPEGGTDDAQTIVDAGPSDDAGDSGPAPTALPLVLANVSATSLAIDDANVYFVNTSAGDVEGVAKSGGAPFVVAPGADSTSLLQLSGGLLYWNTQDDALHSAPTTARDAAPAALGSLGMQPFAFVITGGAAYAANTCDWITELPLGPDAAATATTFIEPGCNRFPQWLAFALDSTSGTLDTLDDYQDEIQLISLATATYTSVPVDPTTQAMAVQGTSLYWVTFGACATDGGDCATSTLYASALDGSSPHVVATGPWVAPVLGTPQPHLGPITGTYAFLTANGIVVRIALATGENHAVYTAVGGIGSVVADDTHLYVTDAPGLVQVAY